MKKVFGEKDGKMFHVKVKGKRAKVKGQKLKTRILTQGQKIVSELIAKDIF